MSSRMLYPLLSKLRRHRYALRTHAGSTSSSTSTKESSVELELEYADVQPLCQTNREKDQIQDESASDRINVQGTSFVILKQSAKTRYSNESQLSYTGSREEFERAWDEVEEELSDRGMLSPTYSIPVDTKQPVEIEFIDHDVGEMLVAGTLGTTIERPTGSASSLEVSNQQVHDNNISETSSTSLTTGTIHIEETPLPKAKPTLSRISEDDWFEVQEEGV